MPHNTLRLLRGQTPKLLDHRVRDNTVRHMRNHLAHMFSSLRVLTFHQPAIHITDNVQRRINVFEFICRAHDTRFQKLMFHLIDVRKCLRLHRIDNMPRTSRKNCNRSFVVRPRQHIAFILEAALRKINSPLRECLTSITSCKRNLHMCVLSNTTIQLFDCARLFAQIRFADNHAAEVLRNLIR